MYLIPRVTLIHRGSLIDETRIEQGEKLPHATVNKKKYSTIDYSLFYSVPQVTLIRGGFPMDETPTDQGHEPRFTIEK